jgi:hypothetical protein
MLRSIGPLTTVASDLTRERGCGHMANTAGEKPRDDIATRIMAAMVKMPPKPHDEMKVGRRKRKAVKVRRKGVGAEKANIS